MRGINPRPLVFCGPSGSGKTSLVWKLLNEFPDKFGFSVSHTTRKPRDGEQNGVHYHFTDKDSLLKAIKAGEFIEHAVFNGNIYGTSKAAVKDVLSSGRVCILDIDMQGVKQIKNTDLKPVTVFVKPPSLNVLEHRLKLRNTEHEEAIKQRLDLAKQEIAYGEEPGNFDLVVVNDDLDATYNALKDFVMQQFRLNEEGDSSKGGPKL